MRYAEYYLGKYLNEIKHGIETMPATYWFVIGSASFVVGVLLLRGNSVTK